MDLEYLSTKYDMSKISKDIIISTISACCSFKNCIIDIETFFNIVELDNKNIKSASYGDKNKPSNNKKTKRSFFNQITLEIYSPYKFEINKKTNTKKENKGVNIKIFKNGSVQMCGVKCIDDCKYILNFVVDYIKINKLILNDTTTIEMINFKLSLINCKIDVKYNIKREKLYELLKDTEYPAVYSPCIHAAVKIKSYPNSDNPIPILIFQSGSIIILTKTIENVIKGHNLIINILNKYKDQIIRKNNKDLLNILINEESV